MSTMPLPAAPSPSRGARLLKMPLVRLLLGIIAVVLPVALTMALTQQLLDKSLRQLWPQLLAAALCVAAYVLYVRKVERRQATELSRVGAGRELAFGILLGSAIFLLAVGAIAAAGAFHVEGYAPWTVMIKPFAEIVLVALFEEILFRAIFFRIIENWLGSTIALALSGLVFAVTHLPNDNSTLLAFVITALAGVMFCAAYMVTRRLWLAVGIHFIWNFMGEAVFSLPVSGHAAKGMLQGRLSGPEWLSGGAYGIEGSVLTLAIIGATALWLLVVAARRGQFLAPASRRRVAP
ncbi:CPBP family intramembrane metalloprotease [Massilia eurypsychrophila]|uniref:CPBP family intramembrane metalloprotease n=1 Tax=Massilia eurypsychrophila TaxID=1485217 RepID=A0A2G8T9I5_9BURK|nr:type II CAAX endopeptidase family protein [Massilia eurypsychrophila]PIL42710.1 CPBP family intramembrane metalloprotease [Massilia eurypsychrophila]